MTNEEAKQVLSCSSIQQFCLFSVCIGEKVLSAKEALDMAIKALEQEPICPSHGIDCEDCPAYDPCGDAISRQGVLDLAKKGILVSNGNYLSVRKAINELPSVNPTKIGHWIPVSERLPEGYCLFCDIDGDVFYGHIYDKRWWAEGQDDRIKNVIAWMPLPKPFEPQESETGMSEEISREEIAALLARESEEQE